MNRIMIDIKPLFLALFLIPPFKQNFLSRLTCNKFSRLSSIFVAFDAITYGSFSFLLLLFSLSHFFPLPQNFNHFISIYLKQLKGVTKLEIRTTAKHHKIIIRRCKFPCFLVKEF
ncbi:hypothetical protein AAHE18_18G159600 [Arachis hypogaea]